MIAAVLDLHERASAGRRRAGTPVPAERRSAARSRPQPLHHLRHPPLLRPRHYGRHPRKRDRLRRALGQTAGHDEHGLGVLPRDPANQLAGLRVRGPGNCASVDDVDVGRRPLPRHLVTLLRQGARELLGIALVDLAAESEDPDAGWRVGRVHVRYDTGRRRRGEWGGLIRRGDASVRTRGVERGSRVRPRWARATDAAESLRAQ